jgi:uncharacterized protein YndB with AHSA1/START domain
MWSNQVEIEINTPPEITYAYLSDFTRHAEWSSNVSKIELIAGETGRVGAEYRAHEDVPRDLTSFARITALDPPKLIAWESTDHRVFRTNWEFELQPTARGTRLIQRVTFHPLNLFANVILYVFRVPRVARENTASLERIRERVQAGV